jgi:hypothetical protein
MTEGETLSVQLDASTADVEEPSSIAPQIPLADSLPPGTRVSVLPAAKRDAGVIRRLLQGRTQPVPKHARCTALLVRGYVGIASEGDAVWGFSSPC